MADQQLPKRDLAGWAGLRGKTLRYVLLRHSLGPRSVHYDLMLELRPGNGASARTLWGFQRTNLPKRGARRVEWRTHGMHRRRYLAFEGALDKNCSSVERIDSGYYCVTQAAGHFVVEIAGTLLFGRFKLFGSAYGRHVWIRANLPASASPKYKLSQ